MEWLEAREPALIRGDTAEASGPAVALAGVWLASNATDSANALLEITGASADLWLGVVGANFEPSSWAVHLPSSPHFIGVHAATGECYSKGDRSPLKLPRCVPGSKVRLEVDTNAECVKIEVLPEDDSVPEHLRVRTVVRLDNLPPRVALCVGFGADGSSVKLVDGATGRAGPPEAIKLRKDLWDADNRVTPMVMGEDKSPSSQKLKFLRAQEEAVSFM